MSVSSVQNCLFSATLENRRAVYSLLSSEWRAAERAPFSTSGSEAWFSVQVAESNNVLSSFSEKWLYTCSTSRVLMVSLNVFTSDMGLFFTIIGSSSVPSWVVIFVEKVTTCWPFLIFQFDMDTLK